jgi:hypothetical protein
MDIVWLVRMLVVMPMMRRPPERSLLRSGPSQESQRKLSQAGRFEGSVGEIPMKSARDPEFPQEEKCCAHHQSQERRPHEKGRHCKRVNDEKKDRAKGKRELEPTETNRDGHERNP